MTHTLEKAISIKPPAPTTPAVRAHRQTLEIQRDALRASAIELAYGSAKGDAGAREALAAIPATLAALQFEIDLSQNVQELAQADDFAAEKAWRAAVQTLPADEIILGINKDECCHRCTPGAVGGCVLAAAHKYAPSHCCHPVKEAFSNDERGLRVFPFRDDPRAATVFYAACEKLKVRGKFA